MVNNPSTDESESDDLKAESNNDEWVNRRHDMQNNYINNSNCINRLNNENHRVCNAENQNKQSKQTIIVDSGLTRKSYIVYKREKKVCVGKRLSLNRLYQENGNRLTGEKFARPQPSDLLQGFQWK